MRAHTKESSTMTNTMDAIEITKAGGPDVLQMVKRARPAPKAGEVLIKVAAAGINRPDVFQRMGKYPPPPGASDLPGLEVSGIIEQIGDGASRFKIGDAVCALLNGGGYAAYACTPEQLCLPAPQNLSLIEAAALPETCFTVWHNVFERGALKQSDNFLIHGGTSGIGTTAIQIAKATGAFVIATAGSDTKCDACLSLGADAAINYREKDFVAVVMNATLGHGADVILDMVGGNYVKRNIECAAVGARIMQIATLQGAKVEIDMRQIMGKRLILTGSTLRPQELAEKTRIAAGVEHTIWPRIAAGQFRPVIARVFPLSQAPEAHKLMESGAHIGKIVLSLA